MIIAEITKLDKSLNTPATIKENDELSLNKVLAAIDAQAATYKLAGMTHISSLLAEAS